MRRGRDGLTLAVWASPGARRSELAGVADGRLRVRVHAPAAKGRANDELVRFLAETLAVRRGDVRILAGASARRKLLGIDGVTEREAEARLGL